MINIVMLPDTVLFMTMTSIDCVLTRIRALYAKLLEKDAMIKVLQERSRREQARPELAGLRPARSVPSINTVATTTTARPKGERVRG